MEHIVLADLTEWAAFAEANKEALLEIYPTLQDALTAACQGGIELGGGAAPPFHISFAD